MIAIPRRALSSCIRQALAASVFCAGLAAPAAAFAVEPPAGDVDAEKSPAPAASTLDAVKVTAAHEVIDQKKHSPVIKDSVIYDEMDSYGDETLAESLMSAPGISAVEDAGEPRYVTIRGIQPNLNFTTIDGIAIASVGGSGSGERMNNPTSPHL